MEANGDIYLDKYSWLVLDSAMRPTTTRTRPAFDDKRRAPRSARHAGRVGRGGEATFFKLSAYQQKLNRSLREASRTFVFAEGSA